MLQHDVITLESMIRTQIQLSESQARRVRAAARREGVSLAEVIRRCVDQVLDAEEPDEDRMYEAAMALAGRYEDREGATDLALHHDDHLPNAFE